MYFFKFLKWFWTVHLRDAPERMMGGLVTWLCFLIPIFAVSSILDKAIIMTYFMAGSGVLIGIIIITACIFHIRKMYFEWQEQVFNKLKDMEEE